MTGVWTGSAPRVEEKGVKCCEVEPSGFRRWVPGCLLYSLHTFRLHTSCTTSCIIYNNRSSTYKARRIVKQPTGTVTEE